jgi:hypothetical protein
MAADAAKPAWLGSHWILTARRRSSALNKHRVAIFQSLGLFLATATLRRLEEDVQHLAISASAYRRGRSSAKAN